MMQSEFDPKTFDNIMPEGRSQLDIEKEHEIFKKLRELNINPVELT